MKNYILPMVGATLLTATLIASFNGLIDPYDMWHDLKIPHLNALKPEAASHQRLHETSRFAAGEFSTLILGTSRADIGLNPMHRGLIQPAFNLAMSSQPLSETLNLMRLAQPRAALQQVIFATDFFTYNANLKPPADAVGSEFKMGESWKTALATGSLFASIKTMTQQTSYDPDEAGDIWTDRGLRAWSAAYIHKKNGERAAAVASEFGYATNLYLPQPSRQFAFVTPNMDSIPLYRDILRFAHENKIDMRILVSPSHARQWHLVATLGLWNKWENWKRMLVQENEKMAQETGRNAFPVWDFSGFNRITSEAFPALCDKNTRMRWYWESSHYKRETGDLVLDRVFNKDNPELPPDFGAAITPANIEAHLAAIRRDHEGWTVAHPQDVAEIARAPKISSGELALLCP